MAPPPLARHRPYAQSADYVAADRLDDAFRQYLAEQSARRVNVESVGTLVAGAARVRRTGQSLSALGRDGDASLARCGANLDDDVRALRSWFIALGDSLVHATAAPPPHTRNTEGRRRLFECVREAVAGDDKTKLRAALALLWASQQLDNLRRLEAHLGRHAFASGSEIPGAEVGLRQDPIGV